MRHPPRCGVGRVSSSPSPRRGTRAIAIASTNTATRAADSFLFNTCPLLGNIRAIGVPRGQVSNKPKGGGGRKAAVGDRPLLAGVVRSRTAASWQRNSQKTPVLSGDIGEVRMPGQGRIQPFFPRRTFEAFVRPARDIGQSTSFCPTAGCKRLLTKPHHRGRAGGEVGHKASLCLPARLGRKRAKDFSPCG